MPHPLKTKGYMHASDASVGDVVVRWLLKMSEMLRLQAWLFQLVCRVLLRRDRCVAEGRYRALLGGLMQYHKC